MTDFTPDMHHKLGHYVYRLIDPRDGSTFYVGRGQVNRMFEHIKEARKGGDLVEDNLRQKTIRRIREDAKLEPIHVIRDHYGAKQGDLYERIN